MTLQAKPAWADALSRVKEREASVGVVGLGYVGLPLAAALARHVDVVGVDANPQKIARYRAGEDPTGEVGGEEVARSGIRFTCDAGELERCSFVIVAVPTPVRDDHAPDLGLLEAASVSVGAHLSRGAVVVYESTVYPGATEDVCVPLLEDASGMTCGRDFTVGYSPERMNPGDAEHGVAEVVKVVSGWDEDTLDAVAGLYRLVVRAGVHRASSIRVAEAAKVIENSQRDINIAFMNELALIFDRMGIDTSEVLSAARTKWNFVDFKPGLVGGHCIGVDPYYLTDAAARAGYHSEVILAGRRINDDMGRYVAMRTVKLLMGAGNARSPLRVAVLGLTFKENCADARNSRVRDIVEELRAFGIDPLVVDPLVDPDEAQAVCGGALCGYDELRNLDAVVVATAHDAFRSLSADDLAGMFAHEDGQRGVLVDVKGIFDRAACERAGLTYWRL